MNTIYNKPHLFFWISIPFILGLGISGMHETVDINIHDMYFIITNWHLSVFISMGFAAIGLVYWSLFQSGLLPIPWMTLAHLICSIDVFIILWLIVNFDWLSGRDISLLDQFSDHELAVLVCLAIIAVGQIIFIFNVLLALIRNTKADSESQNQNTI